MHILGVGLPRTGTASVARALEILGFSVLHHAPERIDLDNVGRDTFDDLYRDVDAVLDAPACFFFEEVIGVRRRTVKLIHTVRDDHDWFRSIAKHTDRIHTGGSLPHIRYTDQLHSLLFGSAWPQDWLWRRAYCAHNRRVWDYCTRHGTPWIRIDVTQGEPWRPLCNFLGVPVPTEEFPWENRLATELAEVD